MKIKCARCGITCWHYNERCMACGCLMTKIIEMPGLFYVYRDKQSIMFHTAFDPNGEVTISNLLYHATFVENLEIKFISEEWRRMLAMGTQEEEAGIYALLQSNKES